MVQTKKETANMGIYKVGNNANITNFVCLWKSHLSRSWEVRMSHKIYDQSPGSASGWKEIFSAIGPKNASFRDDQGRGPRFTFIHLLNLTWYYLQR